MFDEPELHVIKFPENNEWKAERDRQRAESRRRYRGQVALALVELGLPAQDAPAWSESLLDRLFAVVPREGGDPCSCSCHPRLPESDFHGYGEDCACQRTAQERRRFWEEWQASNEAYWNSPEGLAEQARRQQEEDQLVAWLAGQPDVVVSSYGGMAPEQWWGSVAGRRFYFRERNDSWRIELDLRPSGRFVRTWRGGDLDDEGSHEPREIEEGDVIAEGLAGCPGYGRTPVERAEFIVGLIPDHLGRARCQLHGDGVDELARRLGERPGWCPACGTRLG